MKAFYFAPDDKRLRHGDNRKIRVGTTHKVDCEPELCRTGLHASKRLIDALSHAPGHHLYLVELGGKIVEGDDKCCATERKYLAYFNAEKLLREFARKQSLINIQKIKPYCSDDDYELILRWLTVGDKKIRKAAWSAAMLAARSVAESAVDSASWSEAESAAWSEAWTAAESAAWSAAEPEAWSASWTVAESASWTAVWSEARSAAEPAWSDANARLTDMVRDATGWDI